MNRDTDCYWNTDTFYTLHKAEKLLFFTLTVERTKTLHSCLNRQIWAMLFLHTVIGKLQLKYQQTVRFPDPPVLSDSVSLKRLYLHGWLLYLRLNSIQAMYKESMFMRSTWFTARKSRFISIMQYEWNYHFVL